MITKAITRLFLLFLLVTFSLTPIASQTHEWDWPYKRKNIAVMNNLSTLQFYGPYPGYHHGLDLLANGEEEVFAPVSGKVGTGYYYKHKSPYTYEISIELEDGYRVELHHIDPSSIPEKIERLAKEGGRIEKGEYLGKIYNSTHMNIPMHLHTNLINPDGYYSNPLHRYPKIADLTSPKIETIFIAEESEKSFKKISTSHLLKNPDKKKFLMVKAHDHAGKSDIVLGIYKMEVTLKSSDKEKQLHQFQFDQLPEKRFTKGTEIYLSKPISIDGKVVEPGNMNAVRKRNLFYKIPLSTHLEKFNDENIIEVTAYDFNGNKKIETFAFSD